MRVSPGAERTQPFGQRDVQTIGQKRNQDVRLDPFFALMKDRPDRQIALEILKRLFDVDQLQVQAPELSRIGLGQIGAQ